MSVNLIVLNCACTCSCFHFNFLKCHFMYFLKVLVHDGLEILKEKNSPSPRDGLRSTSIDSKCIRSPEKEKINISMKLPGKNRALNSDDAVITLRHIGRLTQNVIAVQLH